MMCSVALGLLVTTFNDENSRTGNSRFRPICLYLSCSGHRLDITAPLWQLTANLILQVAMNSIVHKERMPATRSGDLIIHSLNGLPLPEDSNLEAIFKWNYSQIT